VEADELSVGIRDVDGVAAASGERRSVLDALLVQSVQDRVEVASGADGEAQGVEAGQGGRTFWVTAQRELQSALRMLQCRAAQLAVLPDLPGSASGESQTATTRQPSGLGPAMCCVQPAGSAPDNPIRRCDSS
jgi:hypothetical protein